MISIGYIVGTSIAAALVLAAIGFAVALWRDDEPGMALGINIPIILIVVGAWVALAWPPFDMDYHRYDTVTGTVTSVEKRLVSEGEGMSEKYVVALDGDSQQYGCLDTRCSAIKKGEPVEMSCIRVWAWYGSDGFDCEFISANGRT